MPPGTGDVQMGLARMLPRAEMIIVTTPAVSAQKVAIRAATMARKSYVRVVGVIENMSAFRCDHGDEYALFGEGGGAALAHDAGVPLLGQIPIESAVAAGGDAGEPVALGDGPAAEAFRGLADLLVDEAVPPVPMAAARPACSTPPWPRSTFRPGDEPPGRLRRFRYQRASGFARLGRALRRSRPRSSRLSRLPSRLDGRRAVRAPPPGLAVGSNRSLSSVRRASSSSLSSRSAAATLASSWATELAPGIATTFGRRMTHASATWAGVASCAAAISRRACEQAGGPLEVVGQEQRVVGAHPGRWRVVEVVATAQQTLGQRAVGDDQPIVVLGVGHQLAVGLAHRQAVLHLVGQHGRSEQPFGGAPPQQVEVADPDVAHEPDLLQPAHAPHGGAVGHKRVRPVHLVEVDLGDLEPAGRLDGPPLDHRRDGQHGEELGGQEHLVAPLGDGPADDALGLARCRRSRRCRSG